MLSLRRNPLRIGVVMMMCLALHSSVGLAQELAIQTGPIVGYTGTDFFTVTCRTSAPAVVTIKVDDKEASSPAGVMHVLKIGGLAPGKTYAYTLSAAAPGGAGAVKCGPHRVTTFAKEGKLTFAATGDNRSNAQVWGQVAAAIEKASPAFVLHTGDMVSTGTKVELWDETFYQPAKNLLATVPFYPVWGNHEANSKILNKIFSIPDDSGNWAQQIGSVLIIGGDVETSSWAEGSKNTQWLDQTLQASKAPFIFMEIHAPAWSSGKHGSSKVAQQSILPILEKHHVTALVSGHDHCYERSEPPAGTTCITTGGGGAPLYKADHAAQNPHSKFFRSVHHYLIFTVDGATCTMQALTLDGQVLDTRTWRARGSG